jgi:hypothetical protein
MCFLIPCESQEILFGFTEDHPSSLKAGLLLSSQSWKAIKYFQQRAVRIFVKDERRNPKQIENLNFLKSLYMKTNQF